MGSAVGVGENDAWADLNWTTFLSDLNLAGLLIDERWRILHKTHFDFFTDDEPHWALSLFWEVPTGRYFHKVFGRTIAQGQVHVNSPAALKALAQQLLHRVAVCRGFDANVKHEGAQRLKDSHLYPYPRKTSPDCQVVFKVAPESEENAQEQAPQLCPHCAQAIKVESVDETPALNVGDYLQTSWRDDGDEPEGDSNAALKPEAQDLSDAHPDTTTHQGRRPLAAKRKTRAKKPVLNYTRNDHDNDDDDSLDMLLNYSSEEEDEEEDDDEDDEEEDLRNARKRPKKKTTLLKNGRANSRVLAENDRDELLAQRRPRKGRICNHCNKYFNSGNGYRNHRARLRKDERRLSCKHCDAFYYSFADLAEHMQTAHPDVPLSFKDHLQDPEDIERMARGHKCSICSLYFNSHVLVFRHKAFYHELGDFHCQECDQHLLTYYHLVLHNYNEHDKGTPFLAPPVDDLVRTKQEDGKIKYSKEQHICPDCKKVFKYDSDWGTHMKTTHSWWVFECQECDEMCHYAKDFSAHIRHFHADHPVIHCPKCFEQISLQDNPDQFNEHFQNCVKRTQAKKRENISFQCDKCGKNYSTQYLLQCHLMSHEGVEKYICEKCDYGTNLKKVMEDHQKAHMRAEGLTQDNSGTNLFFHCDQCPKRFSRNLTLNRHIKSVHEGIKRVMKCKTCDATFNSSSMLYIHKRRVHGFVSNLNRRGRRPH